MVGITQDRMVDCVRALEGHGYLTHDNGLVFIPEICEQNAIEGLRRWQTILKTARDQRQSHRGQTGGENRAYRAFLEYHAERFEHIRAMDEAPEGTGILGPGAGDDMTPAPTMEEMRRMAGSESLKQETGSPNDTAGSLNNGTGSLNQGTTRAHKSSAGVRTTTEEPPETDTNPKGLPRDYQETGSPNDETGSPYQVPTKAHGSPREVSLNNNTNNNNNEEVNHPNGVEGGAGGDSPGHSASHPSGGDQGDPDESTTEPTESDPANAGDDGGLWFPAAHASRTVAGAAVFGRGDGKQAAAEEPEPRDGSTTAVDPEARGDASAVRSGDGDAESLDDAETAGAEGLPPLVHGQGAQR